MVKSNSCASRLELTGTHLDDSRMSRLSGKNSSVSHLDHEDSVRTIIRRIESNSFNEKRVPRIIESKCIEKTGESKSKHVQFQFGKDADTVLSNQALMSKNERLGPVDILSQVSVNNHINSQSTAMAISSDKPPKTNVVQRNRNVDLALEMSKGNVTKTSKEKANKAKRSSQDSITGNGTVHGPTTTRTEPSAKFADNGESVQRMMDDLSAAIANTEDQTANKMAQQSGRLVKWDTLSAFDEKNYITNDISLKQKPKYDEIEFEEFEVIEPST